MKPLTADTIEMTRQGLLNSEWCGFSKRDTVNQLCDLALKGCARSESERLREAEGIILRLTMDHNSTPNYVMGFEEARDYFGKYPPLPPLPEAPQ